MCEKGRMRMRVIKREAIIWKKQPIFWALLVTVVVAGYFGHLGYPFYDEWNAWYQLMGMSHYENTGMEVAAYGLLWKTMVTHIPGNLMNLLVPVLLVMVTLGRDLENKRVEGACVLGERPENIFVRSWTVVMVLTLILTLIPIGMVFWRMQKLMVGYMAEGDINFFVKPFIRYVLEIASNVGIAYLAIVLFARYHHLLGGALALVLKGIASLLKETVAVAMGKANETGPGSWSMDPRSYYMVGVDTMGIDKGFVIPVGNDAAAQVYGVTLNICDLVLILVLTLSAAVVFVMRQKKALEKNNENVKRIKESICHPEADSRIYADKKRKQGFVYVMEDPEAEEFSAEKDKQIRSFFDPKLDVRDNLYILCFSQKKLDPARVEDVIRLVGLDGYNERKKPLKIYTQDMMVRYELAAMALAGQEILIPEMAVSETDREGAMDIRIAISRLREQGYSVYLRGKQITSQIPKDEIFLKNSGNL